MKPFQERQLEFTQYLRDDTVVVNKDINRRKSIYKDLVKSNINRIISDSFPISKKLIIDTDWRDMVDGFIANHLSQTPYFLEICQEFLAYLSQERIPRSTDRPFLVELAHFEWITLAIDVADIDVHFSDVSNHTKETLYTLSPLVIGLTYQYPVHLIDDEYLPSEFSSPIHLIIYRNRYDQVQVMETNALTIQLVRLMQMHESLSCKDLFNLLLTEIPDAQMSILVSNLSSILSELAEKDVVLI